MDVAESHLHFSLTVHRALASAGENACFSPYSVASALGLVAQGARGKTAEELVELLTTEGDLAAHAALLSEAAKLAQETHRETPVLAVANTLWAWDQLPLEDGFRAELAGWPGGKVASAPFVAEPEAARALINDDVAETTHGLIPALLPPGAVRADTVASLVNALYLRTAWTFRFPDAATRPADFHTPAGVRQVPTMHLDERVGYAHADGWQAVRLVAAGGVHAIVLLPDGDLAEAEAALDAGGLSALIDGMGPESVRLALPKLDLDVASPLTGTLESLGVRTMFTPDADLGGLSPDPRLVVSDVLHQAVLRIDEQGLEGAAATAVMMRAVSMITSEPVDVRVDRPFLLLIRHAETGAVYFLARVVAP
ncbi:serpin family protein [Amycolatopsis sp. H20-H5]|uniref:serpin family protein n=1 Tax=Amycolatopsis sp. H20-H5 TaxID=3046309 RepID=UPI002DB9043C|nr:serpin family protein [Amycolatopsis sp. H20-H5]MEC3981966.1 serpin family protein [Amycolatopsis sp. H20-H5]